MSIGFIPFTSVLERQDSTGVEGGDQISEGVKDMAMFWEDILLASQD